jgi:hypothetical protein
MGLIHEKNKRPKISCFCPFKIGQKWCGQIDKVKNLSGFLKCADV